MYYAFDNIIQLSEEANWTLFKSLHEKFIINFISFVNFRWSMGHKLYENYLINIH